MSASEEFAPIRVFSRPRPVASIEGKDPEQEGITHDVQPQRLVLKLGYSEKCYNFNYVFNEGASNGEVYDRVVAPMVLEVFRGFNCTVLTYGQRGSGKTHTVLGDLDELEKGSGDHALLQEHNFGFVPRAAQQLLDELSKLDLEVDYSLRFSLIEIYNNEVRDMLDAGTQLRVYDDPIETGSVFFNILDKVTICNIQTLMSWLQIGLKEHKTHMEKYGQEPTYATLLFAFDVDIKKVEDNGDHSTTSGQLFLFDMIPSDHVNLDLQSKDTVNLDGSITALKSVVKALWKNSEDVPYGNSTLTRILQNSFGGNCNTAIVGTYFPCTENWDETVRNLDFIQTMREINNTPTVNIRYRQANVLTALEEEVRNLKIELTAIKSASGFYIRQETHKQMNEELDNNNKKIIDLIKRIRELENLEVDKKRQYQDLERSFEVSREDLDYLKAQLTDTEHIIRESSTRIEKLTERQKRLLDKLTTLRDTCDASTSRETLYYDKFQEKCLTNERNVEITKEMLSAALACLNEDMRCSIEAHTEGTCHLKVVDKACQDLMNERAEMSKQIDEISEKTEEMPTFSASYICPNYSDIEEGCKMFHNQLKGVMSDYKDKMIAINKCMTSDLDNGLLGSLPVLERAIQETEGAFRKREEAIKNSAEEYENASKIISSFKSSMTEKMEQSKQLLRQENDHIIANLNEELDLANSAESPGIKPEDLLVSVELDSIDKSSLRLCAKAPFVKMLDLQIKSYISSFEDYKEKVNDNLKVCNQLIEELPTKIETDFNKKVDEDLSEYREQLKTWKLNMKWLDEDLTYLRNVTLKNLQTALKSSADVQKKYWEEIQQEGQARLQTIQELQNKIGNIIFDDEDTPQEQTSCSDDTQKDGTQQEAQTSRQTIQELENKIEATNDDEDPPQGQTSKLAEPQQKTGDAGETPEEQASDGTS